MATLQEKIVNHLDIKDLNVQVLCITSWLHSFVTDPRFKDQGLIIATDDHG